MGRQPQSTSVDPRQPRFKKNNRGGLIDGGESIETILCCFVIKYIVANNDDNDNSNNTK